MAKIVHNIATDKLFTCEGHNFLFSEESGIQKVIPLIITTKDQIERKISLFVKGDVSSSEIHDAIDFIKNSYGDKLERFQQLEEIQIKKV